MLKPATIGLSTFPRPKQRFVLLVDDHAATLSTLRQVVELAGHSCFATISSFEAVRYCRRRPPSLVVTDLAMPYLNGHGLGRFIKKRYPSVPILLVTGELLDPETLIELRQTFAAVICKPLPIEPFLRLLNQFMSDTDYDTLPLTDPR